MKGKIILLSALLTGCSTITMVENGAQFVVSNYCKVPATERAVVRSRVDSAITPNSIKITCAIE